jgi:magnesium-protoporphyrin O-methyltransferase
MLIEALESEDIEGATLLDIGGGVGAIQHELLRKGLSEATAVDAASAYLQAALEEAERQGHADRVHYRQGDFVQFADDFERADIVTLDRVVCCYHDFRALVERSVDKATRLYCLVYPRDVWWTRLGNGLLNFYFWLIRNPFRTFVHSERLIDDMVRGAGFEPRCHLLTPNWQVVVYSCAL